MVLWRKLRTAAPQRWALLPGMRTVYINGKFTAQSTTGVQRFAHGLVSALDAALDAEQEAELGTCAPECWVLLCPHEGQPPALSRVQVRKLGRAGWPAHAWEQLLLPWASRDGLLLNLTGSAPLLALRQACTLHDAAVFDQPQSYSWTFATWYRFSFARQAGRAQLLFTVSEFSRQRLAQALGLAPARFEVLHNSCDHLNGVTPDSRVLGRHGLEPDRFLLTVGAGSGNKNLAALQAAVARLQPRRGLKLVVVGAPDVRVFAAEGRHVEPAWMLRLGRVEDAELKALYGAATLLVAASPHEGFGLPALEAMASGCAVAAARGGALPEVCGDAAIYFDAYDADDLARCLDHLLSNPTLLAGMRQQGLQRASQFTASAPARRLLQTLRALPALARATA